MNADKNSGKSSVSGAQSYQEIGEYWDAHDLSEAWDKTEPAEFAVDAPSSVTYVSGGEYSPPETSCACRTTRRFGVNPSQSLVARKSDARSGMSTRVVGMRR